VQGNFRELTAGALWGRRRRGLTQSRKAAEIRNVNGQRIKDHFVDVTEMIAIGKGGQRAVRTVLHSRYACYLVLQNADPGKEIVTLGQTYFVLQTRRQEISDRELG